MSKLYLFPIGAFLLCQVTIIATVLSAKLNGRLDLIYIDAIELPPESCVFSQLINVCSILFGFVIYIRYRQIKLLVINHEVIEATVRVKNEIAFWMGIGTCIGLSLVANFQLNVPIVHYIGACVYCCFGIVYLWLQGIISYYIHQYSGSLKAAIFRLIVAFFYTYLLFMAFVTSAEFVAFFTIYDDRDTYNALSVSSQWIAITIFNIYILSFTSEFKLTSVDHIKFTYSV